jgi:hypothetical protein
MHRLLLCAVVSAVPGIALGAECAYEYQKLAESMAQGPKTAAICVEPFQDAAERMEGIGAMLRDEPQMTQIAEVPVVEQVMEDVDGCMKEWLPDEVKGIRATVEDLRGRTQAKGCHVPQAFADADALLARLDEAQAATTAQGRSLQRSWRTLRAAIQQGHERWERQVNENIWGDFLSGSGGMDDILRDNAAALAEVQRMTAESQAIAEASRAAQRAATQAATTAPPPVAAPAPPKPAPPKAAPPKPAPARPAPAQPATAPSSDKAHLTAKPIREITHSTDMWYSDRDMTLRLAYTGLQNQASAYCEHNTFHTEIAERDRKCDQNESFGTVQYKCTVRAAVQCRAARCEAPFCGFKPSPG